MALQQTDFGDIETLLLLIIAIVLVTLILYIGARLIAGKKDSDTGYIIRLVLIALIIVILVAVVIGAIVSAIEPLPFVSTAAYQLVPVLVYLAIVYLLKYLLIPEKSESTNWHASIWIAVITLFLIYLINAIAFELGFPALINAGI